MGVAEPPPSPEPRPEPEVDVRAEAYQKAKSEIDRVLALPPLPGAPAFEQKRAQLVARAKSEPIVFIRTPQADPETSKGVLAQREYFQRTDFAWRTLRDLRKQFRHNYRALRQLFLSDGYLYSESPNHAFTLVSLLDPSLLFDEEEIWVQRGERLFHAKKGDKERYYYSDGSEQGKRVRLLHLDRIGTGPVPEPMHVDLRNLRYRLFFQRAEVKHITDEFLVLDLVYGELKIPTVVRRTGAHLELVAEMVEPGQVERLKTTREQLRRRMRVVSKLRSAMRAAIDEGLPFDEPKTEFGQEDGKLRREWRRAYLEGHHSFRFNDDRYNVFNREGQPLVPQVCIDFMVDSFQRASGSWWRTKTEGVRERTAGKLEWGDVGRDQMRRTKFFVQYAEEHPDRFDVRHFPENDRVELGYKDQFFAWLQERVDDFDAADIILIRGMTPWDEEEEHTHSFFVYETDPLTGVPIAIAGNAGPANLWSWETEARRTPHRTVRTRIRPRLSWLETFIEVDAAPLEPPELISGKK